MKMSLAWVEAQIEHELERGNTPEAVRDLAALLTVREYMQEEELEHAMHGVKHHDPALDTAPTMEQVEKAMGALTVSTEADKKRMHDLMTWAKILKGED